MNLRACQLLDVFTNDEVNLILQIIERLPDNVNSGDFYAYTNGFTPADLIYQMLDKKFFKKIEDKLGQPLNVRCGMHLKEVKPWIIHTDYHRPFDDNYEQAPGLAALIPLKVVGPADQKTHTIVFNESCQTNFAEHVEKNGKLLDNAASIHQEHCSHVPSDDLDYVSLNGAYAWRPGSVLIWDRSLLHCSDNFLKNSITEKQALVLFG